MRTIFNNTDTMSFEAATITNINSPLSHHQDQLQFQHHHTVQNTQQQFPNSLTSSVHSAMSASRSPATNNTMFDANANPNVNVALSPLQNQKTQSSVECVMPDIYLTKDFISWKEEQLRTHGFTHIIIIDKHIQELYYPNQQPDIFKLCSMNNEKNKNSARDSSSSLNAFDCFCPPSNTSKHLSFGKEYEVIDLNFGEKSYLTTVLPNCYRAVKFINKALQGGGTILVIDCNGGEQKCLTIIVAYLMYKNNISFSNAFARLKEFYKKADLDRFYSSQLYEYEPILQVQRAQSRGHSCSRELHAAILKRKKSHYDDDETLDNSTTCSIACYTNNTSYTNATATTKLLLNNCNPLNRFDSTQMRRQEELKSPGHTFTHFMNATSASSSSTTTGGWYNWDDCVME